MAEYETFVIVDTYARSRRKRYILR